MAIEQALAVNATYSHGNYARGFCRRSVPGTGGTFGGR